MKLSYVTVITTDHYLKGALVLRESLLRTKSTVGLLVLLTNNVSKKTEVVLKAFGIATRRVDRNIEVPSVTMSTNNEMSFSHWNNTLGKLFVFDLLQFDKVVYLDSDMMLLDNIDTLFSKPHMSAVNAGKSYPTNVENAKWERLNSGLMVIEPEAGLIDKLVGLIPEVAGEQPNMGDQDVINSYYKDWSASRELPLDEKYNVFHCYLDYYVKRLGYRLTGRDKKIAVIHFIGTTKPWMRTCLQQVRHLFSLGRQSRRYELIANVMYITLLAKVDAKRVLENLHGKLRGQQDIL